MEQQRPGTGQIDLGLSMRGTKDAGIIGGMLSADYRASPTWSLTAEATAGMGWSEFGWAPSIEAMIGARGTFR